MVEIRAGKGKPMNRNKLWLGILSPLFFWALSVQTGCKLKDNGNEPAPTLATDVYVAGYSQSAVGWSTPCYWRNGIRHELTSPADKHGYATSLFVVSESVHVAGVVDYGYASGHSGQSIPIPSYWKDGVRFELPVPSTQFGGHANSIFIANNDVYICGGILHDGSVYQTPCYWKNGELVKLKVSIPNASGSGNAVFVSADDVYIVGDLLASINGSAISVPCLWKNGVQVDLSINSFRSGLAESLFVIGSDVFVAGTVLTDSYDPVPCVWNNGEPQTDLSVIDGAAGGWAYSLFVLNGDVYVAGMVGSKSGFATPCTWKNAIRTDLPMIDASQLGCGCNSIAVSGDDVYAAGFSSNSFYFEIPCYWKNGVRVDLSVCNVVKSGRAFAIFVVKN
jgi:hypothetical protein